MCIRDSAYINQGCVIDGEINNSVPVSYTHLDVYKRQIEYQTVQLPANADTVDAMLCLEYVRSASFFMLYKANREKKLLCFIIQ